MTHAFLSPGLSRLLGMLLMALMAAVARADVPAAVIVIDAWAGATPPTAQNGAAYLALKNGPNPDRLLAVSSPVARAVEIHEMRRENGLLRMREQAQLPLAPKAELSFMPGGRHLMLIGLKQPLRVGDSVPLILKFRHAGTIEVRAVVREHGADSAPAPGHRHHH